MGVSIARYTLGVAGLLLLGGSVSVAAVALRRRWWGDWRGAPARLAEAVLALTVLELLLELIGVLGLLRFAPIAVGAVAVGAITLWRWPSTAPMAQRAPALDLRFALPGLAAAAAVFAEWLAVTLESYTVGIRTFDSVWYHLPWAASFAQSGQVASLRFTDIEYLTAFYPATSELLHGTGIALLSRDTLSPGINLVWLGLALLAAYVIGRARGVGWLSLIGAAVVLATPAVTYSQAGSAANDIAGMFFVLAATGLLLTEPGRRRAIVLAALAAGLAAAVKLSMLAAVAGLTVAAIALAPRGRRWGAAGAWFAPLLTAGGFWYLRNLIAVGNPLPWVNLPGLAVPTAPLQAGTGFSLAHYLFHGGVWTRYFEPGLAAGFGPWWLIVVLAALAAALACLLSIRDRPVQVLGGVALLALAAFVITPETAAGPPGRPLGFAFNLRYAAPSLVLAVAVLPLAAPFRRLGAQVALLLGLGAVLIATLAQARLWPAAHGPTAAIVVAVVAAGVLIWMLTGLWRPRGRGAIAATAVLAAALLIVALAGGYAGQRSYLRGRFAYHSGVSYLARSWALFRDIRGRRVGVVGTFGGFATYPYDGPDDSNRVTYIARRGPHGSFTAIRTCRGWRAAVNAGHFDYLVTTPGRDPWRPRHLLASPETAWTAGDPNAHVVYRQAAKGLPITVFRLTGPLHPAGCPTSRAS